MRFSGYGIMRNKFNPWLVLPSISALSLLLVFFLDYLSLGKTALLLFALLPLSIFVLCNLNFALMTLITSMWINHYVAYNHIATYASLLFLASFLLTYRRNDNTTSSNPLLLPFLFYLFCLFPSLSNASVLSKSLIHSLNLLAVAIVFTIVAKNYQDGKSIKRYTVLFMALAVLNGINVIALGIGSGKRVFGFTGIVYVDFVCVAIIIAIMMLVSLKGGWRLLAVFLLLFLLTALIFTQTRNTLVSLMLTMSTMLVILFIYHKKFNIRLTNLLIGFFVAISLVIALSTLAYKTMPDMFKRHSELVASDQISINEIESFSQSTLLTRLFIWHTAINAFLEHPFIGIGAYAFPYDAERYAKIPTVLVKNYVKGLSPHVTYLTVITETGLLGLTGFLFFWLTALIISFKAFKLSVTLEEATWSFGLLFVHVYIYFSMAMSDAWFWGQCAILWGLLLGISSANYNHIKLKYHSIIPR